MNGTILLNYNILILFLELLASLHLADITATDNIHAYIATGILLFYTSQFEYYQLDT